MGNIGKLIRVLTIICIASSTALALVHTLTKERIAEEIRKETLDAVRLVLPPHDNEPDKNTKILSLGKDKRGREMTMTFYKGEKDSAVAGYAFDVTGKGFGGTMRFMVGVDDDGRINGVKVLGHSETPGLGAKMEENWFVDQFKGLDNPAKMKIKKDGGELDQITGASITARAAAKAIADGLTIFLKEYPPSSSPGLFTNF
jgi:electron transport complex protein RnfG